MRAIDTMLELKEGIGVSNTPFLKCDCKEKWYDKVAGKKVRPHEFHRSKTKKHGPNGKPEYFPAFYRCLVCGKTKF